jgi:hypothetical protein
MICGEVCYMIQLLIGASEKEVTGNIQQEVCRYSYNIILMVQFYFSVPSPSK